MTSPNLSDLIERVEAATEGSRELDALIWCHLNGKRYRDHNEAYWGYRASGNPLTQVEFTEPPKRTRMVTGDSGPNRHATPVTTSLDAAMTLVPEGWCFTVATYWCEGEDRPPFFADCGDLPAIKSDKADATIVEAWAATPALALVAAALKARALQDKDIEHG